MRALPLLTPVLLLAVAITGPAAASGTDSGRRAQAAGAPRVGYYRGTSTPGTSGARARRVEMVVGRRGRSTFTTFAIELPADCGFPVAVGQIPNVVPLGLINLRVSRSGAFTFTGQQNTTSTPIRVVLRGRFARTRSIHIPSSGASGTVAVPGGIPGLCSEPKPVRFSVRYTRR